MNFRRILVGPIVLLSFAGVLFAQKGASAATEPLYLSPAEAHGGKWCFNPNSPKLQVLTAPVSQPSDLVDAAALAADLKDLREFLRTQYPGYSLLAQAPDFNVDDFFRDWRPQRRFGRSICVATLTGTQ